jgi:hypothetical protein
MIIHIAFPGKKGWDRDPAVALEALGAPPGFAPPSGLRPRLGCAPWTAIQLINTIAQYANDLLHS